ncbi:MAG: hypothetical protein K2Y39_28515 [Candidatus Obscuribacterales bacterium]|nr:hypothetical protein [Candidatus Obscuribacterales bacterium]
MTANEPMRVKVSTSEGDLVLNLADKDTAKSLLEAIDQVEEFSLRVSNFQRQYHRRQLHLELRQRVHAFYMRFLKRFWNDPASEFSFPDDVLRNIAYCDKAPKDKYGTRRLAYLIYSPTDTIFDIATSIYRWEIFAEVIAHINGIDKQKVREVPTVSVIYLPTLAEVSLIDSHVFKDARTYKLVFSICNPLLAILEELSLCLSWCELPAKQESRTADQIEKEDFVKAFWEMRRHDADGTKRPTYRFCPDDTLELVARDVYGDERVAALIAGLNGIGNTIEGVVLFELDVGTQLYLPTDAEAERFLNNL